MVPVIAERSSNKLALNIQLFFLCLQIYEIGGGSGTCAKGIMDYIMLNAPARVYNSMSYMYVHRFSSFIMTKKLNIIHIEKKLKYNLFDVDLCLYAFI